MDGLKQGIPGNISAAGWSLYSEDFRRKPGIGFPQDITSSVNSFQAGAGTSQAAHAELPMHCAGSLRIKRWTESKDYKRIFVDYLMMKMVEKKSRLADIKTKPTTLSVVDFISTIPDELRRKDCIVLLEMMMKASGEEPLLWSNSIIGFGIKRYKSPTTSREVDWLRIGFSPRKANIALYLSSNLQQHAAALVNLGKHKTGVGCLYINKLEDVDLKILEEIIADSLNRH